MNNIELMNNVKLKISKIDLRREQGNRSLLDIALNVHSTKNGSFERSAQDQNKDIELLEKAIILWSSNRSKFDSLVYDLITEAINEKALYEKL